MASTKLVTDIPNSKIETMQGRLRAVSLFHVKHRLYTPLPRSSLMPEPGDVKEGDMWRFLLEITEVTPLFHVKHLFGECVYLDN